MASIETLEERAAPSESIGVFLGLGLAGGLFPSAGDAGTALAADVSLAASTSADHAGALLPGEEGGIDFAESDESSLGDALTASTHHVPRRAAPPLSPPAQVNSAMLPAILPGTALASALDDVWFALAPQAAPEQRVPAAASRDAHDASAIDRPTAGLSASLAIPRSALGSAHAEFLSGPKSANTADATLQPSAESPQRGSGKGGGGGSVQPLSSNNPPVAVDDETGTPFEMPDMPVDIGVTQNDSDPDGDSFEIYSFDATSTEGGSISQVDGGTLNYTAPSGFTGIDTFTYDLIDFPSDFSPGLVSNRATVTINVGAAGGGANNPPQAINDTYYVLPGVFLDTSLAGLPSVLLNDTDADGDELTAVLVDPPTLGTMYDFGAGGHFIYLAPSAISTDTFTYKVSDGSAYSNVATVTIEVIEVSIKYPHGDPSASETNWIDRDSNEANLQNERTFSGGGAPGVSTVTVSVEAAVTPAGLAGAAGDWLTWTIDDVGPVQAEWSSHVPGNVHVGKGTSTTATYTTPASGLPANNSAFGSKQIELRLAGSGIVDSTNVEIFYRRDSKNHDGGQPGAPNFYHYWSQTAANDAPNTWIAGDGTGYTTFQNGQWRAFIQLAQGHSIGGVWNNVEGIDLFANTVRHEEQHRLDMIALWGANSGVIAAQDQDGDWLPDAQEPNLLANFPYDPTDPDTFPDTFNYLGPPNVGGPLRDIEHYALSRQVAWGTGTANDEDWADPGMQHAANGDADD